MCDGESHTGDEMINDLLLLFGYSAYIIPEICGSDKSCRNTLWTTKKLPHDIIAFFHLPLESRFNLLS